MNIAIIGAGISGLTAGYRLVKQGHSVTIIEKATEIGGLGAYIPVGGTFIERYYHHFFQTDTNIIELAEELGIADSLKYYSAKTGIVRGGKVYSFSGAKDLLSFPLLNMLDRVRCGAVAALFKYYPGDLRSLDLVSAEAWMLKYGGKGVYETVWKPLLYAKFGEYAPSVSALWLRERVRDRSPKLGYFDGSVKMLFDRLIEKFTNQGGIIQTGTTITGIFENSSKSTNKSRSEDTQKYKVTSESQFTITTTQGHHDANAVILAVSSPIAAKLIEPIAPKAYLKKLKSIEHIGAVCVVLELNQPVQDNYWLSICDDNAPVLAVVEHTNMLDAKDYSGKTIMYMANYLHRDNPRFKLQDEEIIKTYSNYLKTLNPQFKPSWIEKAHVSKAPFAQTIFPTGSYNRIPPMETPIKNLYHLTIDQMYPHDRNLHQGVGLGNRVGEMIG